MSRRTSRVASSIQRAMQTLLSKGLQDPRVRGIITVTGVRVNDDLSRATIMVSIMPEEHAELTMHGLRSAARYLRRQAGDMMDIRRLPEFGFELDGALKRQAGVLEALQKVRDERELAGDEPDAGDQDG